MTGDDTGADADVRWTQVDGVNVAWGPEPGPLRASLIFRIGKADEHLHVNGITHLVEHLALHPLGQQPHYQNGAVRTSLTSFDTAGDPAEVSAFLTGVCTSLGALPVDRLAMERRVVETEASRRPGGTATAALAWRYGPNGPGLWSADEYATATVDGVMLQAWADQVFTRENAVLVLSGPPPAGLSLPLGSRGRLAVPQLVNQLPTTPAWFEHDWPDVGLLTVLPRSSAAVAYAYALQHELVQTLRYGLGMAYSPGVDYEPYDGATALVLARADGHRDHLDQVAQVVAGTVIGLAERGPSAERLREYRDATVKAYAAPGASLAAAVYEATDLLLSGTHTPIGEVRARLEAMSDSDVAEAARAARDSVLYALPRGVTLPVDRAVRAPQYSLEPPVVGRRLRLLGATPADLPGLVVAVDGVTLDQGEERVSTVRFATCRACLAWPDGRRVVVSPEGVAITIEPTLWESGPDIVDLVDRSTARVRVPQPAREAGAIPTPPEPAAAPPAPPGSPAGRSPHDAPQPAVVTGLAVEDSIPSAAFAYDSAGRPLNQFGTPIDVPYEPLGEVAAPTRRRGFAWRTRRPATVVRAAVIAIGIGAVAAFAGGQGLRTMTTSGLPPGQAQDGSAGAIYVQSDLESMFHLTLLVGIVVLALGLLTLAGVRAAGALLLLVFTVSALGNMYTLITLGLDYFRHGTLLTFILSVSGFLSMTNPQTLHWIRRG